MDRCSNKTALISGAGRGIGAGIAKALSDQGAYIFITDIDEAAAQETTAELIAAGGKASALKLDVTSPDDWEAVAQAIKGQKGQLDILVNNAGIEMISAISDLSLEDWRLTQSINVDGIFLGVKACLDLLKVSGAQNPSGAAIVNMSSIAGIVGITDQLAYNTSKGAVRSMSKAMAIEFASKDFNIRVNSIHPGCIATPMLDDVYRTWQKNLTVGTDNLEEVKQIVANLHPLKRIGTVEDIAMAVIYVASDEAGFMTGSELVIDGGWIAQ